ncbi:MAG: hypothetical protein AAFR52_21175 [Pseudomonadota bacterium]
MKIDDDDHEVYEFGWWPEIFGAAAVGLVVWYLITFARGSL